MLQHKHLIVRAEINAPPFDTARVEDWLNQLISDLGMKVLYGPFAMYSNLKDNEGMTAGCILTTSHCVLHTWDKVEKPVLQLDIYTCSDLDLDIAWKAISVFQPTKVEYKFLDREHNLKDITCANSSLLSRFSRFFRSLPVIVSQFSPRRLNKIMK